jgi:hypothetical protein
VAEDEDEESSSGQKAMRYDNEGAGEEQVKVEVASS